MSEPAKKKRIPRKPRDRKPLPPVKDKQGDADDIERAVYDGMQDLRTDRTKQR